MGCSGVIPKSVSWKECRGDQDGWGGWASGLGGRLGRKAEGMVNQILHSHLGRIDEGISMADRTSVIRAGVGAIGDKNPRAYALNFGFGEVCSLIEASRRWARILRFAWQ